MDYQSTAGKMAADFMQRSSKELEECGRIFDRMFPDPCPYFAMGEWAAMITAAPVGTPLTINNKPAPPSPRPMINWEILAETYAIGLREAKAKIVALEAEVARLTPPAPVEHTTSDVLARCMKADRTLDVYGR